jgi:hypothetical protein
VGSKTNVPDKGTQRPAPVNPYLKYRVTQMPAPLSNIVTAKTKELIAQGTPATHIASELGISSRSVSRIRDKYKDEIERTSLQLIADSLKPVRDNHRNTIEIASVILKGVKGASIHDVINFNDCLVRIRKAGMSVNDFLKLSDQKEYRAQQMIGVVPSHTTSPIFQMLFIGNNKFSLNEGVLKALLQGVQGRIEDDSQVIDADVSEIEQD